MRVERTIVLPAPRGEVWQALSRADRLGSWMGVEVELEARPGGRVVFTDGGRRRWGTVEVFDAETALVVRLWERTGALTGARLEFRLDDADGGTRLTVVESRIGPGATPGSRFDPVLVGRG